MAAAAPSAAAARAAPGTMHRTTHRAHRTVSRRPHTEMDVPENFYAAPSENLLPVHDLRAPIRALVASLAPGGAERIVLEWLDAERQRGRDVELAVLHPRRIALTPPSGVRLRVRGRESTETFLHVLAAQWQRLEAPVATHLITDSQL